MMTGKIGSDWTKRMDRTSKTWTCKTWAIENRELVKRPLVKTILVKRGEVKLENCKTWTG